MIFIKIDSNGQFGSSPFVRVYFSIYKNMLYADAVR